MTCDHRFWHYTCDHGHAALGAGGTLLTAAAQLGDPASLGPLIGPHWVWATDLAYPQREPLGLTSVVTPCDRTAHRYRVINIGALTAWTEIARQFYTRAQRDQLELAPGAMPRHWFVGINDSIIVEYDPV